MPYKDPEIRKQKAKERYLKNLEDRKAKSKKYYEANREKFLERAKKRAIENSEKIKSYQAKYRQENKEKTKQYKKQYYLENKQEIIKKSVENQRKNMAKTIARIKKYRATAKGKLVWQIARNARRKRERHANLGGIFHKQILEIYAECKKVSLNTGTPHEVDHIIPLMGDIVCGLHVPWNLRIIPAKENRRKTNKFIPELL